MNTKRSNTTLIAVIGGIIALSILVIGSVWTGRSARESAEKAVRSVSNLYLDELAGRRGEVVEGNLENRIHDMQTALGLMSEEDLSDMEHLQAYQKRMKQLYKLEKFAFVGSDGLIYTSLGTQDNIADYRFDYETIQGPEISILNPESEDKKVIIALPVSLGFMDKTFKASFMEIDMGEMLKGVSVKSGDQDVTFANIYTREGIPLTNKVLAGLAEEDNLFDAMKNAEIDGDMSSEKMAADFSRQKSGEVSFVYKGIPASLSYVPVTNTDWMMTYMIRESVITNEIESITSEIIQRSLIQTALTAAVLLLSFSFIFYQTRRNAQLAVEKETADAAARIREQELEQRLALQDQLLEQEKLRAQQDSMITALSSDYRSVYYVDLDRDEGICYFENREIDDTPKRGEHFPYLRTFREFGDSHVAESFREGYLQFIEPEHIRRELEHQQVIAFRFLEEHGEKSTYSMLRIAGVRQPGDSENPGVHALGIGFTDIDEEMRKNMAQQQMLSDALAAAEQASQAKTAFLSNMSHEIRTPMNAIIGLDSLALHNQDLPEETRSYLENIGESARHLLGLINDILDMSRIESGRMILRSEEFSFRSMLEQINTMVMSQCREKGLTYECNVIGGISDYYIGDDMKLKQVLINILSNAIKFTDAPGTVTLSVERTNTFEDQSTLKFVIKDTGIGMDKSFIPKLFDSFTQESTSRSSKYGSTGLGMAITKNIVTLMNGSISVESEKGVGSEFTVFVTLKNCEYRDRVNSIINVKDMRVLVVDDEEIAAEHARIILEEVGIRADTCRSGQEALHMVEIAHIKNVPYNLILLDWKMPEMDGIEVASEVRKRYDRESMVIILTSFNWDDIMAEAMEIGVDSFLAKPLFASNVIDEFERIARRNNMSLVKEKKRADLKGKHILMAEDIFINAEIMKQLIQMKEAEIDHAENGRIAVEMFENSEPFHYDAVLMDIRMPEMDGLQAASAIRALNRPDAMSVPIIALTANAFDEDVQRSLQVGMNAHLSKPVEPEHLYQTMEELIYEAEQNRPAKA